MKTLKEADLDIVFCIGQTSEGDINIYKAPRSIIKGMVFETWMSARRYALSALEDQRIKIMNELFTVDKAIRRVNKLKESKCRELQEDVKDVGAGSNDNTVCSQL